MGPKTRNVKRRILVAAVAVAAVLAGGAATGARQGGAPALEGRKAKLSYAVGMDLGEGARKQGLDLDAALIARGLRDALSGGEMLLTGEEARATLVELQGEMKAKQLASERELAESNKKEGDAFLAENQKKEGVVTLASGLQYKVLDAGDGKRPTDDEFVECSYRGTRVDGTEFDSSERRGRPAALRVGALIPGWREALKLMPVGSKWQLVVPPDLAYGPHAPRHMPQVGPNATVVYDIALLGIRSPPAATQKTSAAGQTARPQAR